MKAASAASAHEIARDIERVVVTRRQIARRVGVLGRQIARAYAGQELTILAVLTGSLIFLADLIRRLPMKMRLNVISISSYPATAMRSQGPRFLSPLAGELAGKNLLVVDDILDSGGTLSALLEAVRQAQPASVRSCVLLAKARTDLPHRMMCDFVGFNVADEFLVGYGLDYDSLYRNLPDICVLRPECYRPAGDAPAATAQTGGPSR